MEKEHAKLTDLYKVFADQKFREKLLRQCQDDNVKLFWKQHYTKMPKDASIAVLTKMYRLVQERIIVPLFMAEESCIDFRDAMDQQKMVIVDLPEGQITTDIANFVGSLILSKIYLSAMTREDTPENQRVPFYIYVDEAYRYTTKSIPETLQSLRKFKIYMTAAGQYLEQYKKDTRSPPHRHAKPSSPSEPENTPQKQKKFYPK